MKFLRRILPWAALALAAICLCFCTCLVWLRWFNPPFTMVQIQRRMEAGTGYKKRWEPIPLNRISTDLQHAVIAAEDGRFYQHHGIDWQELDKIVQADAETGHIGRGGSTITQQLVKNLFVTTRRSYLWKGFEFALAPVAELILSKKRILELYLNVIEWGPGVYGAEAAAKYYYGIPASRLSRDQAARLAACIPSPRKRRPALMDSYSAEILNRMHRMNW
jgi:monofunctional biosynthetic peptidoglycan transglycosylase